MKGEYNDRNTKVSILKLPPSSVCCGNMHLPADSQLALPDLLVMKELLSQNTPDHKHSSISKDTIQKPNVLNNTSNPDFDPTVFQFRW